MKRGRADRHGRSKPRAKARPPRARMIVTAAGIVGGVLALALWFSMDPASDRRTPVEAGNPWGDVPAGFGAVEAWMHGNALAEGGQPFESLPYLHMAAHAPSAPWQAWRSYGSALFNGSLVSPDPGTGGRTARSSFERIAMMREAVAALDRSARLAPTPPDRAIVNMSIGQQFRTWGLPWNALEQFHAASRLDAEWKTDSEFYAALMRNPDALIRVE